MSVTKRCVKKTENKIIEHYEAADDRCGSKHCRIIDGEINQEWTKGMSEIKFNRSMIMHSNIIGATCDMDFNHSQPFNESIT